tara:strand:+ start:39 stop:290 length:252 start_codon:yes stop_codon:yes gene_type:complete
MENPNLELYQESCAEDAIQLDGLDYAVLGVTSKGYYVYDYDRMIECFVEQGMTIEEAIEWIDYNVISLQGGHGFEIMYSQENL